MWGHITSAARVIGLAAMVGALGWSVWQQKAGAAQPSEWVRLRGERPALSLDKTMFAGQAIDSSAHTLHDTARSDWIYAGSMALREPNLTFMIQRRSTDRFNRQSLVNDLREISELRSPQVTFRNRYHDLATRFGQLRGVSFEVNADGVRKFCTGYHTPGTGRLLVKGYLCATAEAEASPQAAACLVDGIRFAREEDDQAAMALLPGLRPAACGAVLLDPNAEPATQRSDGGI